MGNLGLLFTRGVSLATWVETGLIDREKAIYERELEKGIYQNIIWFTYGSKDLEVYKELVREVRLSDGIKVVAMPRFFRGRLGYDIYSLLMPVIQKKYMKNIDLIKSNQMDGAWTGILIKKIYHIPFYFRTGYTNTKLYEKINRKRDLNFYKFAYLEKKIYQHCDYASVSSNHDKAYVCSAYNLDESKIKVIVNYIDIDQFYDKKYNDRKERIVYVGRLSEEKNLFNIIEAVYENQIGLDIYGKGPLSEDLQAFAEKIGADVCFKGTVDNNLMPEVLNSYKYYILASIHEGMPKALLEAMACGCICIGTAVEGIDEVIADGVNGYLAKGTDSYSISEAIRNARGDAGAEQSRCNAQMMIREGYSLDNIIRTELQLVGYKSVKNVR